MQKNIFFSKKGLYGKCFYKHAVSLTKKAVYVKI